MHSLILPLSLPAEQPKALNGSGVGKPSAEVAAYRRQLLLAVQGKLSDTVTAALRKILMDTTDDAALEEPSTEVMM